MCQWSLPLDSRDLETSINIGFLVALSSFQEFQTINATHTIWYHTVVYLFSIAVKLLVFYNVHTANLIFVGKMLDIQ